jgi:hypothetical protein
LVLIGLSCVYTFGIAAVLNTEFFQERYGVQLSLAAVTMVASVPIGIWQLVGSWRSLSAIGTSRGSRLRLARFCGRILIALLAVWASVDATHKFVDAYASLVKVVSASTRYTIRQGRGGPRGVLFTGEMAFGSAKALEVYLAEHPDVKSIELNSPGGSFQEASRIAKLVRQRKLVTFVRQECLSACTLAYSAGSWRLAMKTAKFGFHRAAGSSLVSERAVQAANERFAQELHIAGIDARFIAKILEIEQPQIMIANQTDLQSSRFVQGFIE